ncbi:hypothetical protein B0O80DRAFT_525084 [Mortierella sp. GBAus27b]|nr:hypothetical protein B0O80DRAFT_525084 [Mortierella sp. GBAus27b]
MYYSSRSPKLVDYSYSQHNQVDFYAGENVLFKCDMLAMNDTKAITTDTGQHRTLDQMNDARTGLLKDKFTKLPKA